VLELTTATGVLRSGDASSGREAQSSAFLSAPGIDELYSGVANSTASEAAIASLRLSTAAGWSPGADQDGWLELFADDAISHDPVGAPPATGRSELSEIWRVMTSPFKKLTVVPEHIFHAGSGAAVKWSARGQSEIGGSVEFGGISVFEFSDDGKILTVMSYWDPAAMMIELAAAGERSG
jgi:ketosteroid isomerase-like protein